METRKRGRPKKDITKQPETFDLDEIEDEETSNIISAFAGKEPIDKTTIVMEAWRNAIQKRAKEMIRGFWKPVYDKGIKTFDTWIEDTRNTFISSVIALESTLKADMDEDYLKFRKEKQEEEEKIFKYFAYKQKIKNTDEMSFIMPEVGSSVNSSEKGLWDNNVNQWIIQRMEIYTEILGEISKLLKRLKYFGRIPRFG